MKRVLPGLILSAILLAACTDSQPTANNLDQKTAFAVQSAIPNPCTTCTYGPQKFVRRHGDKVTATFAATPGSYNLSIEDDGDPLTTAVVWLNGVMVVDRPALLDTVRTLVFPVTLAATNTLEVSIRGGFEHFVTIWLEPTSTRVFGPQQFVRAQGDKILANFQATGTNCILTIQDDGDPLTTAVVWLNGVIVIARNDLKDTVSLIKVPVTLTGNNTLEVAVRGGAGHSVTIWIDCGQGPPPSQLDIIPDDAEKLPGGTQQFTVASGPAGPYTWSVRGVDGGDATFGTITGTGFYIAPALVPAPAGFQVCARVTAQPSIFDCANVTITAIPTAGEDVVVYNDINMLDDNSMIDPNNVLMLHNLLTYTTSGPRGSGTEIVMDAAHAPICGAVFCGASYSAFQAQVASEGLTLIIQTVPDTVIGPKVKVLVLWLPTAFYSIPEINAMKRFASEGGRIVFIGEHSQFYGGGFPAQNDFLTKMGAQMTNVGDFIDCGYNTQPASSLRSHQITTGMSDVTMACSSQILLGPNDFALYYDLSNTKVLSGVAKIDVTPLPGATPLARRVGIPAGWKATRDALGNLLH